MTLTAEQVGTKTVLGEAEGTGYPILWEADDEIWVRSAAEKAGALGTKFKTSTSSLSNGGRVAEFTGTTLDKGPYVAVYPFSLVTAESTNEKVTVSVPQEQGFVKNSFGKGANICAAVWSSGSRATFTSVAGVMRLGLKGFSSVRRIEVADNDPSFALWGNCEIVPGTDGVSSVKWVNSSDSRNKIVINCDTAVTLNLDDASYFYIVAPAGAFAKGFTCTLFDASGAELKQCFRKGFRNRIGPLHHRHSGGPGPDGNPLLRLVCR